MADNQSGAAPNRKRGPGRPWKPGQSGNPAGRPKGVDFRAVIEQMAREDGITPEAAVLRLVRRLDSISDGGDAAAVKAAQVLLDRLCGPVKQEVAHEGGVSIRVVTGVPPREGA